MDAREGQAESDSDRIGEDVSPSLKLTRPRRRRSVVASVASLAVETLGSTEESA